MASHRLYTDLSQWFALLTPPEDYVEEAGHLRRAIRNKLGPGRHKLLDLGVGGGHHLSHLVGEFEATGVDLSPDMLARCREVIPDIPLHTGDMRSVRLGEVFDVVQIHDAVTYLLSEDDIRATLETARAHLRPGGVLVMAPDDFRETYRDGQIDDTQRRFPGGEFTCFMYDFDPDPDDTTADTLFFYVIRRGAEIEVHQEQHTFGLFSQATWLELMRETGFAAEVVPYAVESHDGPLSLLVGTLEAPQ